MEAAGLAIGAVGLASMFAICVQCFDLIEIGRNLGDDYELMVVKLSIEKRRLMIWGEAVGVLRPDEDRDALLDEPETRALVEQILLNVSRLFGDAETLKSKYGLEERPEGSVSTAVTIEGSTVCVSQFEASSFTQFQRRIFAHRKTKGVFAKTKWAIRDNTKFSKLLGNLKDLNDGLGAIITSTRTNLLKGTYVRQETESIPDLRTLEIIEETCTDPDWRTSASVASSYLRRIIQPRRTDGQAVDKWLTTALHSADDDQIEPLHPDEMAVDDERDAWDFKPPPQPTNVKRHIKDQGTKSQAVARTNQPYCGIRTQVFVMCSSVTLVAWVNTDADENITRLPRQPTPANRITYSQIMKSVRALDESKSHSITVYCPPRMRYLHMAACFADTDSHDPYRNSRRSCCIRVDDRLLDHTVSFPDVIGRMEQYKQHVEDALQDPTLGDVNFAQAIDLSWLERRIDVLTMPGYRPISETLDWNTIFRASHDDDECVAIVILAGKTACETMLNTEPVLPPDYFSGEKRVYRLSKLGNRWDDKYQYKAEHYCNIAVDKKFEKLSQITPAILVDAGQYRHRKEQMAGFQGEAYLPNNPLGAYLFQPHSTDAPAFSPSSTWHHSTAIPAFPPSPSWTPSPVPTASQGLPTSRPPIHRALSALGPYTNQITVEARANMGSNASASSLARREPDPMLAFKDTFNRLSPSHSRQDIVAPATATARFDYDGGAWSSGLSFPKGAKITLMVSPNVQFCLPKGAKISLMEHRENNGFWLYGQYGGREGRFPADQVKLDQVQENTNGRPPLNPARISSLTSDHGR